MTRYLGRCLKCIGLLAGWKARLFFLDLGEIV